MGSHKARLGTLTIPNSGTASNILSNRQLSMARALMFHTPAAFTGVVTVQTSAKHNAVVGDMQPLRKGGADVTLTPAKEQFEEASGFESIRLLSTLGEGAQRDIDVYAILEY